MGPICGLCCEFPWNYHSPKPVKEGGRPETKVTKIHVVPEIDLNHEGDECGWGWTLGRGTLRLRRT